MLARMVSISWPSDLPASASQSAGITGMSHHAQSIVGFSFYCDKIVSYVFWLACFLVIFILSFSVWIVGFFYCDKNIHDNIDHFNHFQVYNSVALNAFTLLCNHHHHPSSELFASSHTEILCLFNTKSPLFSPQLLGTTFLCSESEFDYSNYLI